MPLDTVKVMMQINRRGDPRYASMASTVRTVVALDGAKGLYAGLTPSLLNQCGKVGIQFGAYEWWRLALGLREGDKDPAKVFAAGALAGTTEAVVWTTPLDRLKILRQASIGADAAATGAGAGAGAGAVGIGATPRAASLPVQVWQLLRFHGIRGLYVGCLPTAIRQASGLGVRFLSYDFTKMQLVALDRGREVKAWHSVVAGAVCGGLSVVANNPVDTVKSRLQAASAGATATATAAPHIEELEKERCAVAHHQPPRPTGSAATRPTVGGPSPQSRQVSHLKPQGMWRTMAAMVRDEGVGSLYAGCAPRFLKICAGQAIVFGIYENLGPALATMTK